MAGPCVFSIVITLLGIIWIDYDPLIEVLSALGAENAPHATIMNVFGFGLLGLSIILFSIALYKSIKKHIFTTISVFLLGFSGIIILLLGFIPCDVGCRHLTLSSKIHWLISYIDMFSIPVAIIILMYPLKIDNKWGKAWAYFPLELIIFFCIMLPLTLIPGFLALYGLMQRIGMALILFWMFIMSIKLYLLIKQEKVNEINDS